MQGQQESLAFLLQLPAGLSEITILVVQQKLLSPRYWLCT